MNERRITWMMLLSLLSALACRRGAGESDSEAAEVKPLVTVEVAPATVAEIDDAIAAVRAGKVIRPVLDLS